jgi:hypothetical protein
LQLQEQQSQNPKQFQPLKHLLFEWKTGEKEKKMKLNEYISKLTAFVKEHPETENYDVVCAIDDEGNGFNPVIYSPTIGSYQGHQDFIGLDDFEELGLTVNDRNAVCIN